jgi:uncharacterized protein
MALATFSDFSRSVVKRLLRLLGWVLILLVRFYQVALGPIFGGHCRFQPSCSQYFIGAVQKDGAFRGGWKGIKRVCRCHPWNPGGYDPP